MKTVLKTNNHITLSWIKHILSCNNIKFYILDESMSSVEGNITATTISLGGSSVTTTATLSTGISNGNVLVANANVIDNDFLRVDGTSIEGRSASELATDIGAATTDDIIALSIALG